MGRSNVTPVKQPDEVSCGPASLKIAMAILGRRFSISALRTLCRTGREGTSTENMVRAIRTLGYSVLAVDRADLRQLKTALYPKTQAYRAILLPYLYGGHHTDPHPESGHWAVVASYSAAEDRIVLFDSYSGERKSYRWREFLNRWWDYQLRRYHPEGADGRIAYRRQWIPRVMFVVTRQPDELPRYRSPRVHVYRPLADPVRT